MCYAYGDALHLYSSLQYFHAQAISVASPLTLVPVRVSSSGFFTTSALAGARDLPMVDALAMKTTSTLCWDASRDVVRSLWCII